MHTPSSNISTASRGCREIHSISLEFLLPTSEQEFPDNVSRVCNKTQRICSLDSIRGGNFEDVKEVDFRMG